MICGWDKRVSDLMCLYKMNVKSMSNVKPFWSILILQANAYLLFLWHGVAKNIVTRPG